MATEMPDRADLRACRTLRTAVAMLCASCSCVGKSPGEEPTVHPDRSKDLIREVDENAYRAVVEPDTVAFAHLVRIAADEAASPDALGAPDRIAGYPIRGSLRTLDKQNARAVSEVFSDWSNYLPERLTRCAFEHLIGFRFTRGRERVDIALTGPCWLAMWTFQRNGRIAEWSSPFHREHAAHLFAAADTL